MKKYRYITAIFLLIAVFNLSGTLELRAASGNVPPKYIFLLIGDGMAKEQVRFAEAVMGKKVCFHNLPVQGLTATRSANSPITDSAAAGTAIACGAKTDNGTLGQDPKGKRLESIAVDARRLGRKVGILTTVPITDATPAAFYAHVKVRKMYDAIIEDLLESNIEFFGGNEVSIRQNYAAKKKQFAIKSAQKGYIIINGNAGLDTVKPGKKYIVCRKHGKPSLSNMLKATIKCLDNPKGFFIMAEEGRIDWTCHENDAASLVKTVESFDETVKVALAFAAKHPGQCLIVITADHETGGLKFDPGKCNIKVIREKLKDRTLFGAPGKNMRASKQEAAVREFYRPLGISWKTHGHTGVDIVTYSVGVGAEAFGGKYDNTQLAAKFRNAMGVKQKTTARQTK